MSVSERRERERKERKKHILNAARALLFEKGFKAATIQEIAQLAELSVGTIYIYYKNKEEIFAALQEEGLSLLLKGIQTSIIKDKSTPDNLRNIGRAYLTFWKKHRDYFDIINFFLTSHDSIFGDKLKNRIDRYADKILTLTESVIQQGNDEKIFHEVNSRKFAIFYFSSLHGILQFRKIQKSLSPEIDINDFGEYIIEQVLSAIEKDKK